MRPTLEQLTFDTHPAMYAGELTGGDVTHVMQKQFDGMLCGGCMGRGKTREAAIKDFYRRWDMEYKYNRSQE